ncbi:MAG: hypothetical protein ABH830_01985 [Patescibacteria group bacterium]
MEDIKMPEKSAGEITWLNIILISAFVGVLVYFIFAIDYQAKRTITEKDQTILALTQEKNQYLDQYLLESEKLTEAGNDVQTLRNQLEESESQRVSAINSAAEHQTNLDLCILEKEKFKKEGEKLQQRFSVLAEANQQLQKEIVPLATENTDLQQRLTKTEQKLEQVTADSQLTAGQKEKEIKNLKDAMTGLNIEIKEQATIIETLEKQLVVANAEASGRQVLAEQIANLKNENEDIKKEFESTFEFMGNENLQLETKLATTQEEKAKLEKNLAEKGRVAQELAQELTCRDAEIISISTTAVEQQNELKKKLTTTEQASENLQNRITLLENERADLEKKVELAVNEKRGVIQLFNQEVASRDAEIIFISTAATEQQDELKEKLTTADQKVEKLQSRLTLSENKNAGLKKELELTKNNLLAQTASTKYYEEKSAEKNGIIEQLNQELFSLNTRSNSQLETLIAEMENTTAKAKEGLDEKNCIVNNLEQTVARLRAEKETLIISDAKQRKENTELKENCDSFKETLANILEKTAVPVATFSFALGSTKIQEQESNLANEIKIALKNLDSESFFLIISGESDDIRFKANHDYNNWRLSANRALRVSAALKKAGVAEDWMMQTHCLGLSQWKNCRRTATVYFIPNFRKEVMKEIQTAPEKKGDKIKGAGFLAKIN